MTHEKPCVRGFNQKIRSGMVYYVGFGEWIGVTGLYASHRVKKAILMDKDPRAWFGRASLTFPWYKCRFYNHFFGSSLWKEDNQARALECYFQEQGLAHHCCCQFCGMREKENLKPHVLPLDNRRKVDSKEEAVFLQGFCQRCWQVTSLRQGRDTVGDTEFLDKAGVFSKKIAANKGYRLRGEITKDEMGGYVKNYLKAGKAGGLDGATAETLKSMSEEEMDIIRLWVNSILTKEKPQQSMTAKDMLGRIRVLHKGGNTAHKPSDCIEGDRGSRLSSFV